MEIKLREYQYSDIVQLSNRANSEKVSRYMIDTFPYPYTKEHAHWWVTVGCKANGAVSRVILCDEIFVGGIGVTPQKGWKSHTGEIGYWLGEKYWGRGIAQKSVELMTEFAFKEMSLLKLFGIVLSPNKGSMKVLEKCGYQLEGVLKSEVMKHGRYYDIYHYGKCKKSTTP